MFGAIPLWVKIGGPVFALALVSLSMLYKIITNHLHEVRDEIKYLRETLGEVGSDVTTVFQELVADMRVLMDRVSREDRE